MDTNLKAQEDSETKESTINNAENVSFILGTGKLVTPQKPAAELTPNLCTQDPFKSPLNFSTVTVEQLGITPESFVKNTSGKSSSYLKKSRRRSTVGVRGSPETNHLIRFIAQQRSLKNSERSRLTQDSPYQGSPVLYRNVNSLKERISAFQSAFLSIKENEKIADYPEFSEAKGTLKTTDLTKKEGLGQCQQSVFATKSSSKRRRISLQSNSDEILTGAGGKVTHSQILSIDTDRLYQIGDVEHSAALSEKSSEVDLTQSGCLVEASVPISALTEASHGLKGAGCVEGKESNDAVSFDTFTAEGQSDTASEVGAAATPVCKYIPSSESFVLRSVLKKPSAKLLVESLQEHCSNLCNDGTQPSLITNVANSCTEQKAEDHQDFKSPAFLNMRKRKRVTFGEDLSPEVFDESLPANTPLRKGGTPVCKKDCGRASPLQLEQAPVSEPLSQPNFDDKGENLENIEPLQVSFAVLSPNKSSITEPLSGTDTFSSPNNHEKIPSNKLGRVTRTSSRRKQLISFAEENVCNLLNTEAQPCKEKKMNRRKSQETKGTKRALPKKNQVLKSCRKKKGKGKKSVQKSLYGGRDIASKKPLLSPIPELPEVSEMTPSVPGIRRMCSDFNSIGKLEQEKPPKNQVKRKNPLLQNPEDLNIDQGFEKYISKFCRSHIKSSSLGNAIFGDKNTSTIDLNENKNIPKAENKLESENEPQSGNENENSPVSYASVTAEHTISDNAKPDFNLQRQEFPAADGNMENLSQIVNISEDKNMKCEKQDGLATEAELHDNYLMSDSQKEFYCSDVLIENIKEFKSCSEDVGRSTENSSIVNRRERKYRRCSLNYSDSQSLHLGKNGNHSSSSSMVSSVDSSLENSELYRDLSDTIEQSFQRAKSETKVRRSTRLQHSSESEGLVWISLPFPATSQKTKRRTISTFDNREVESLSPRKDTVSLGQKAYVAPSDSGRENSKNPAHSNLSRKRRNSFCMSTLTNTETATKSIHYRRNSFLKKAESSLTDLESIGHSGELK